jgi:hypothetical protein
VERNRRNRKKVVTKPECQKMSLAQTAREKYEEEGRYRTCSTTIGRGRYLQEHLKLERSLPKEDEGEYRK